MSCDVLPVSMYWLFSTVFPPVCVQLQAKWDEQLSTKPSWYESQCLACNCLKTGVAKEWWGYIHVIYLEFIGKYLRVTYSLLWNELKIPYILSCPPFHQSGTGSKCSPLTRDLLGNCLGSKEAVLLDMDGLLASKTVVQIRTTRYLMRHIWWVLPHCSFLGGFV